MEQLMKTLEEYLVKKAPALPKNIKDLLVQYAPWITIVTMVMIAPAFLALLGLGGLAGGMMWGYGYGYGYGGSYLVSMLVLGVMLVMRALAIPGLFSRSMNAWNLMFYSTLVSAVHDVLVGSWMGLVIGTLVSLYFLFQVKSYYKK